MNSPKRTRLREPPLDPNPPALRPDWPKSGVYKGKKIDLIEAQRTLTLLEQGEVIIDVPGHGPSQPWKQSSYFIGDDGKIYL